MATQNTNWRTQCINAAFYALPDRLQALIDEGHFEEDLLRDIHLGTDYPDFPIWRIPQCWKIAIGEDIASYKDDVRPHLEDFVQRNARVMDIFSARFGVEYTPIDFQQYHECFFSDDPEWTDEEILGGEDPAFLAREYGTRPIDLELYCATLRFDFPRVKELLLKGANPYAEACDDGSCYAFGDIGCECSYLCTCRLSWAWNPKHLGAIDYHDIFDLIGWAAHESMYRWIEEYNTVPSPWKDDTDSADEPAPIPVTIRQAFAIIDGMLSPEDKAAALSLSRSQFTLKEHFGLGLWIRNNWIHGSDENESPEVKQRRRLCLRMLAGVKDGELLPPPDVVSGLFLERYYKHLNRVKKA